MITVEQVNFTTYNQTDHLFNLDSFSSFLVRTVRLFNTTTAYKLEYYERMLNYCRAIGLYILSNTPSFNKKGFSILNTHDNYNEDRISQSLKEFLFHFEIILFPESKLTVNKNYSSLLQENRIDNLIKNKDNISDTSLTKEENSIVHDFLFVFDLIQKYNNPNHEFRHIAKRKHKTWETLIKNQKLDYEIRLCETLYNLIDIKFDQKIKSPFSEDYYTESGQNAFKNFTQFLFLDYLKNISSSKKNIRVFDLGCGYGNYVDIVHSNFPNALITGVEKNPSVYAETNKKFENAKNIEIINDDFFQYTSKEKYDIILMNYVLFYFNRADKIRIIEKAKSMLSENGSIVLCQYYSGIEDLKRNIAKMQNDYSATKKIEMYYSDKILYANTLWNDSVDTFSEAVKWNEFKDIVAAANLKITSMTNADPYYYSLFVELKK